jgi:hypothetical protein
VIATDNERAALNNPTMGEEFSVAIETGCRVLNIEICRQMKIEPRFLRDMARDGQSLLDWFILI